MFVGFGVVSLQGLGFAVGIFLGLSRVWGAGFGVEIAMEGRKRISILAIYSNLQSWMGGEENKFT